MRQYQYGTHIWDACYKDCSSFNRTDCHVCGEPAECGVPAHLVASHEDLGDNKIPLCWDCASDDVDDPSEYPL